MKNLAEQINSLYEQELYSNVAKLCSGAVSICDEKSDIITGVAKCRLYCQYGDSLMHLNQYPKAESILCEALQQRKNIVKNNKVGLAKGGNHEHGKEITSDLEIKYKLYLCYFKMKQSPKAINILQSIPARLRTVKINMALADLYRESGLERSAVSCYKEVLRECPLALEAAESLLAMGVKGIEVNSLVLEGTSDIASTSWINQWLRGQAEMHTRDYKTAISTFLSLDKPGLLKDNTTLLVMVAQCHHYSDSKKTRAILERAISLDPDLSQGLDIMASILAKSGDFDELERLIPIDLDIHLYAAEHWVAMAYHMYVLKKYGKAAYFAQKACVMAPRNVEALILKGSILLDLKKYEDAAVHLREAIKMAPYRYETHEYLISSYIGMNRVREALQAATNVCKQFGHTARALKIYASVLMKDTLTISKARSLLERAVRTDQDGSASYLPAVYLLSDCYEQELKFESAISLLIKHIELTPTSRMHQMLGDLYVKISNDTKAFDHYNTALNLDPKNRRAIEGLNSLGRSSGANKLDNSYYMSTGSSSQDTGDGGPEGSAPLSDHDGESDAETWPQINLQNTSSFNN